MLTDPDPTVRLRAINRSLDRVQGRAITPTVNLNAEVEASPLIESFSQLPPDERRALLQQATEAAMPAARHPDNDGGRA